MSIRILHVLALNSVGGVERLFADYLRDTRQPRFEHHVLVAHERIHPVLRKAVRANARSVHHAKYVGALKLPRLPAFLRERHVRSAVRRVEPDIVVLYNHFAPTRHLVPSDLTVSGAPILYYEQGACWGPKDPDRATEFLGAMAGVVADSRAARRMLELRWGLPRDVASICHNGVRLPAPPAELLSRRLPEGRPVRLGFAGRFAPIKGAVLAVHALARMHGSNGAFELHLAGTGPEEANLKTAARRLGVEERVRFWGLVQDMRRFYSEIDLLLCPSVREPFGNVCIEAAFYGCPAVATAVDGLAESVLDGRTGRLVPGTLPVEEYAALGSGTGGLPEVVYDPASDSLSRPLAPQPEALREAILELCADSRAYTEMSQHAHQRAREEFGMAIYVERLEREFLAVAGC